MEDVVEDEVAEVEATEEEEEVTEEEEEAVSHFSLLARLIMLLRIGSSSRLAADGLHDATPRPTRLPSRSPFLAVPPFSRRLRFVRRWWLQLRRWWLQLRRRRL